MGSQHGCEATAGLATPRPQLTLYFSSRLVLHNPGGRVPSHVPVGFSYLGDFSEDHPSVLPALSQGLHVSQEFFPLLDFLHHWTGRRVISGQGLGAFRLRGGVARAGLPLLGRGCGSVVSVGPQGSPLPLTLGPLHTHTPLLHNWPISGLRSSNRSSSGAASSCRTGRGFFFRSFLSFPVAKIFWSLCFSFSRSPVKAQKWLNYGVKGTPIHGLCS